MLMSGPYIELKDKNGNSNQIAMVIPSTRKGLNSNANQLQHNNHHHLEEAMLLRRQHELKENGGPRLDLVSGVGDTSLKLNIGGMSFRIRITSLFSRTEDERLVVFAQYEQEKRIKFCDAYIKATEEYYFERSPVLFDTIFKYYATGQLHRPLDVCTQEFANELTFWKIPEAVMSNCCFRPYNQLMARPPEESASMEELTHKKEKSIDMIDRSLRSRIHHFCEGNGTFFSTLFTFGSISFVLISVIGLVLGSIHEFQVPIWKDGTNMTGRENETAKGLTKFEGFLGFQAYYPAGDPDVIWEPHSVFSVIETICIIWFTFEYILRISVTPNRIQFVFGIMNIVDLIAIIPFYLEMGLAMFGVDVTSLSNIKGALLVIRILRVLRVVRILKLGRYSSGMRTFALTLRSSARQLGMMGMVLSTGVVFFSTLLYFVEKDEKDTPFTSIPAAFWWAIVTMTTVGYGDYVPVTVPGKLIASGAIISGVLVLALPITIIVDNFMKVSGNANHNIFSSAGQPMVMHEEPEHPM